MLQSNFRDLKTLQLENRKYWQRNWLEDLSKEQSRQKGEKGKKVNLIIYNFELVLNDNEEILHIC